MAELLRQRGVKTHGVETSSLSESAKEDLLQEILRLAEAADRKEETSSCLASLFGFVVLVLAVLIVCWTLWEMRQTTTLRFDHGKETIQLTQTNWWGRKKVEGSLRYMESAKGNMLWYIELDDQSMVTLEDGAVFTNTIVPQLLDWLSDESADTPASTTSE